jgi:hypothetical protein
MRVSYNLKCEYITNVQQCAVIPWGIVNNHTCKQKEVSPTHRKHIIHDIRVIITTKL